MELKMGPDPLIPLYVIWCFMCSRISQKHLWLLGHRGSPVKICHIQHSMVKCLILPFDPLNIFTYFYLCLSLFWLSFSSKFLWRSILHDFYTFIAASVSKKRFVPFFHQFSTCSQEIPHVKHRGIVSDCLLIPRPKRLHDAGCQWWSPSTGIKTCVFSYWPWENAS